MLHFSVCFWTNFNKPKINKKSKVETRELIPYRIGRYGRYFYYRSLNWYRNMLVSCHSKHRVVPNYTGENRTFRPKIEFRTVQKKKTILITCTVILQSLTRRRSPTASCCCYRFFFTFVPA